MSHPEPHSPSWLRHLQENSWEAELLISGGALFALLSASDQLISVVQHLKFSAPLAGLDQVTLLLMVALKGITIGFLLHLVMRGLWISLVCLNYAYPDGINFHRLKLSGKYRERAEQYSLTDRILALDKFSGLIFFGSFAFVVIVLGYLLLALFVGVVLAFTTQWFGDSLAGFLIELVFVVVPVLLYLFDVISGGLIRRYKTTGKLFYPIYIVLNTVSLGFVYRPWMQILFTSASRWKVVLFFTAFSLATAAYANISLAKLFYWSSITDWHQFAGAPVPAGRHHTWYASSLPEGEVIYLACIPDEIIAGNYLRLFVPYRAGYDDGIAAAGGTHFSDIVSVSIDSDALPDSRWHNYRHEKTNQPGIESIIDISNLARGQHELYVMIKDDFMEGKPPIRFPFWKD